MNIVTIAIILTTGILSFVAGAIVFSMYRSTIGKKEVDSAEARARKLVDDAVKEAEVKKKQGLLDVKEESLRVRREFEEETKERRSELSTIEKRLLQKEDHLEKRETNIEQKEKDLLAQVDEVKKQKARVDSMYQQQVQALEKVAAMTQEDAKKLLLSNVDRQVKTDAANLIRDVEQQAKKTADKRARDIVVTAIQRAAVDNVVEFTTSVIHLPSDDMKGRIIGREGRNIRVFEIQTGVDVLVDDTPGTVVLSCFDPIRREIGRMALNRLIQDGRIHPTRVEEMVKKARLEVEKLIKEEGERVALELDVQGLHPKVIELIGRLKYRTSYGQNALAHSIEVCHLSDFMAQELNVNFRLARRAGLLHDIGKAIDFEGEGTHTEIGVDLLRRYGETAEVIHAVEAHHEDVEAHTIEAVIVAAADAISASRPGARRESFEAYIKRLQRLEDLASSFEGVERTHAIQAGREIRVMVKPEVVDDAGSAKMAFDIAKRIERELEYPGQIRVTVPREIRSSEIAK